MMAYLSGTPKMPGSRFRGGTRRRRWVDAGRRGQVEQQTSTADRRPPRLLGVSPPAVDLLLVELPNVSASLVCSLVSSSRFDQPTLCYAMLQPVVAWYGSQSQCYYVRAKI
ncbi:hypothetical protein ABZP36_032410 [Zizania latifolia]